VSPYREPNEPAPKPNATGQRDLVPAAFVLWLAGLALCARSVAPHESIEAHELLAALCVVALPYALVRLARAG
jgi:hypothetical protein